MLRVNLPAVPSLISIIYDMEVIPPNAKDLQIHHGNVAEYSCTDVWTKSNK